MNNLNHEQLLLDAQTVPTGDNCQPWVFAWQNESTLLIYCDHARAKHYFNIHNFATMMSLGMLIEVLRVAAGYQRYDIKYEVTDAYTLLESDNFWCKIDFSPFSAIAEKNYERTAELYKFLSIRYTDRRVFKAAALDKKIVTNLSSESNDLVHSKFKFCSQIDDQFLNYFKNCEKVLVKKPEPLRDISYWLRMSLAEAKEKRDGIYWPQLSLNYIEAFVFSLFCRWPRLPQYLWYFGFGFKTKKFIGDRVTGSSGLYCVTTQDLSKDSLIDCGRRALRVWLECTKLNLAVQPLTLYGLFATLVSFSKEPQDFTNQERNFFKEGLVVIQKAFHMSHDEYPLWLFRVGISPKPTSDLRSLRRDPKMLLTSKFQ